MSVYKIGDVADSLRTTIRTIRFYEEAGLLQPLRTEGKTRLYNERHISRLKSILHLAGNGFSLESIRRMASIRETCKTGDESSKKVTAQLDGEIKEISTRMRDLERLKEEIARAKAAIAIRLWRTLGRLPTAADAHNVRWAIADSRNIFASRLGFTGLPLIRAPLPEPHLASALCGTAKVTARMTPVLKLYEGAGRALDAFDLAQCRAIIRFTRHRR